MCAPFLAWCFCTCLITPPVIGAETSVVVEAAACLCTYCTRVTTSKQRRLRSRKYRVQRGFATPIATTRGFATNASAARAPSVARNDQTSSGSFFRLLHHCHRRHPIRRSRRRRQPPRPATVPAKVSQLITPQRARQSQGLDQRARHLTTDRLPPRCRRRHQSQSQSQSQSPESALRLRKRQRRAANLHRLICTQLAIIHASMCTCTHLPPGGGHRLLRPWPPALKRRRLPRVSAQAVRRHIPPPLPGDGSGAGWARIPRY